MKKIVFIISLALTTVVSAQSNHAAHQSMNHAAMENGVSEGLTPLMQNAQLMKNPKVLALKKAMNELWNAHMYWTLITVDAYYNDPKRYR